MKRRQKRKRWSERKRGKVCGETSKQIHLHKINRIGVNEQFFALAFGIILVVFGRESHRIFCIIRDYQNRKTKPKPKQQQNQRRILNV